MVTEKSNLKPFFDIKNEVRKYLQNPPNGFLAKVQKEFSNLNPGESTSKVTISKVIPMMLNLMENENPKTLHSKIIAAALVVADAEQKEVNKNKEKVNSFS